MSKMAVPDFGDVKSDAGITKLNEFMRDHSYICGYDITAEDCQLFEKFIGAPNEKSFPHAHRWFIHIASYCPCYRNWLKNQNGAPKSTATTGGGPTSTATTTTPLSGKKPEPAAAEEEDEFDVFGDEPAAPSDFAKKAAEKKAEAEKAKKPAKPREAAKSTLVIDVKPVSTEIDLDDLAKKVKGIVIEGVTWAPATKKLPLAFGLMKLQMGCTIVDELVNTDVILEQIETIGMPEESAKDRINCRDVGEDYEGEDAVVMSAEIVSFNKL